MSNVVRMVSTVLMMALGICMVIDTQSFVYLSMSHTLVGGVVELLLLFVVILHMIVSKDSKLPNWKMSLFVTLWILYLVVHSLYTGLVEEYRLLYFIESLLFLLAVLYMLQNRLMSKRTIDSCVVLMAVIQLASLLLQSMGLCTSYSTEFLLTGLCENPNVTAMLLVAALPSIICKLNKSKIPLLFAVVLFLDLIYVLFLRCRTAYLGLGVMVVGYVFFLPKVLQRIKETTKVQRFVATFTALATIVILLTSAYRMKQDSSDGRMLVWKVSASMIARNPQGCGFGLFEKEYNLNQADYFSKNRASEIEKRLASDIYMAYNDVLEQGVETGVMGMLFLLSYYAIVIIIAYRQHRKVHLIVVASFLVMSLVNFLYATVQPWFVCTMYGSLAVSEKTAREQYAKKRGAITMLAAFLAIIAGLLAFKHCNLLKSQIRLYQIQQHYIIQHEIDIKEAKNLQTDIGTSEAYWLYMADVYRDKKEYSASLGCLEEARKYTSSPSLYMRISECYRKMGLYESAISMAEIVRNMIPQNLSSRHRLMMLYDIAGEKEKAIRMANEIVSMPLKIRNEMSDRIQRDAEAYIQDNR